VRTETGRGEPGCLPDPPDAALPNLRLEGLVCADSGSRAPWPLFFLPPALSRPPTLFGLRPPAEAPAHMLDVSFIDAQFPFSVYCSCLQEDFSLRRGSPFQLSYRLIPIRIPASFGMPECALAFVRIRMTTKPQTGLPARKFLPFLLCVTVLCATTLLAAGCSDENGPAEGGSPKPPGIERFTVGAAAASIDPASPVYAGGFGLSPPITEVHDPLSVRAFYVSNGEKALAFAVADTQGWFASTQDGLELGITGVRAQAAAAITELDGPPMTQADILVQASHSHAAPTVEGVWGPVPLEYLQLLHDRTVDALVSAARNAEPALLEWATVDAPFLNNINTAQTDSYPGWTQDGQLSVLRAVRPDDGATLVTFANVPAHPDIVCGACLGVLGADYFGAVRDALEGKLGGLSIVGPATIGREETPVQTRGLENMQWFAGVVTSLILQALTEAHQVTDPTLASAESFCYTKATNVLLLLLNHAWTLPPEVKEEMAEAIGMYPINRDIHPPYLEGTRGGTWLTAARIGGLVYLSMPGEPFPEIRAAIAASVRDADAVVSLSKAQDDLGYFFPAWVYPYTFLYPSDHWQFNVSTQIGDLIIREHLRNAATLGFLTDPPSSGNLPTDWSRAWKPGLQALASPMQGSVGEDGLLPIALQAIYEPGQFGGHGIDGMVQWDFGDGKTEMSPPDVLFTHSFPPGSYLVRLRAADGEGRHAEWSFPVEVYPRLRAEIEATPGRGGEVTFTGSAVGGNGKVLAWRWSFGDGGTASGQTVTRRFPVGVLATATLAVTDGSGATATATATVTP
jgi:PKD domain